MAEKKAHKFKIPVEPIEVDEEEEQATPVVTTTDRLSEYNVRKVVIMTLSGSLGGMAVGYNSGVVAPALLFMDTVFPGIETSSKSNFVNFAILAGTVGALCTDRIGRRLTILLSDLFLIVGGVILTIAIGSISLCFGRLIVGLGFGISLMIGPIYLSECSPIGLRGQICPIYFFMYFLGLILSYYGGVLYETNFYALFGVAIIPSALQFVLMFFTQNDPAVFLAKKGPVLEYCKREPSLIWIQEFNRNKAEIAQAHKIYQQSNDSQSIVQSLYQLFSVYRWNLFVGAMLQILQQFSGINIIQYYGPQIMRDAGFQTETNDSLLYSMMFIGVIMLIGNIICISLSQKYGRRQLILWCTMPMGISLLVLCFIVGINTYSSTPGNFQAGGWISILSMSGYMIFCSIGYATQPWTINSEIFPTHLKGMAISIITMVNWGFNYLTSSLFINQTGGMFGKIFAYAIMAISCIGAFGFTFRFVPETKGKSLEECVNMVLLGRYTPVTGTNEENADEDDIEIYHIIYIDIYYIEEIHDALLDRRPKNKGKNAQTIQMAEQPATKPKKQKRQL